MTPTAWRGIAVIILAIGLSATVVILAVETAIHTGPVSTEEASLLSTVLGAVVGAIAVYLGGGSGRTGPPVFSKPPVPSSPSTVAPSEVVAETGPEPPAGSTRVAPGGAGNPPPP